MSDTNGNIIRVNPHAHGHIDPDDDYDGGYQFATVATISDTEDTLVCIDVDTDNLVVVRSFYEEDFDRVSVDTEIAPRSVLLLTAADAVKLADAIGHAALHAAQGCPGQTWPSEVADR